MTTAAAPERPQPERQTVGDDLIHLWCCDDGISMCGLDISGEQDTGLDDDDPLCPMCALIEDEGLPCPAPGCPEAIPDAGRPTF